MPVLPPNTKTYVTQRYGRVTYSRMDHAFKKKHEAMSIAHRLRKQNGSRIRVEEYDGEYYLYFAQAGRDIKRRERQSIDRDKKFLESLKRK